MPIASHEAFIGWVYPKPTSQMRILFNFSIGTCICLSMTFTFHWNHRTGIIGLGYTEKFSMHPTMDRRFITLRGWPESRLFMGFLEVPSHTDHQKLNRLFTSPTPTPPPPNHGVCVGVQFSQRKMMCQVHFNKLWKVPWRRSGKLWKSGSLIDLVLGDLSW